MPLWEGWDEAYHYSYIQELVEHGTLLVAGKTVISSEIATSFQYAPLSVANNLNTGNSFTTFEDYWKLTPDERRLREHKLRTIPPAERKAAAAPHDIRSYEALHPPLFYFIAGGVYALSSSWDLPTRVFFLRLFCLLLGSTTIILSFPITRYVWSDRRHLVVVPLLLVVLPLFYSTVAPISNDSLGVPLFSALILLVLRYFNGPARIWDAVAVGIALGLGLLTKAYFLTALPAITAIFLIAFLWNRRNKRLVSHFVVIALVSFAIAGWWYLRNNALYGNWSGMLEITRTANLSSVDRLGAVTRVPWAVSIMAMLKEHIWLGNTSAHGLSRAVYRIGYLLILLSIIGFVKTLWIHRRAGQPTPADIDLLTLFIFYSFFLLGIFYHTLVNFVLVGVPSGTGGWYMYAVIIPEVILLLYGFEGIAGEKAAPISNGILVLYALAIDLLSMFCKILPAYAGFFIPRFHLQHLIALYSPSSFMMMLRNLSLNQPPFITPVVIGLAIAAYVVSLTVALAVSYSSAFRSGAEILSTNPSGD
jgi:4-amino-4-deoxy-L-arabinose transferase-like glycosyltransferase